MGLSSCVFPKSDGPCCDCIYESMPKAWRYAPLWHPGISSSQGSARYWKSPLIEKLGVNHHNQYQRSALISPLIPFVQRSRRGTAWESEPGFPQASACKGEDADGVIGGIDFLRKVVRNEEIELGEKVAIVGGGNTAMDACRTAVRLGADKVYNIYRRTKDEMPADMIEIEEAEEEGVIFLNLTNPLEIISDENGHCRQMVLQVMELGYELPAEEGRFRKFRPSARR